MDWASRSLSDLEIDPDPILMIRWEMGERWDHGKVTSAAEAGAIMLMPQMTILTLMTSPGMLTQLRASVTSDSWHLLSSSNQPECLHVVCIRSWWFSTHESCFIMTPSTRRGKCCENLCCHELISPSSSSLCLRHQNLYQHSAGSGIMSLFVPPMSHLVHYEDQDVCHEFCICRHYWPVCCADWVSWPSVPGPPTSLMPPNVPHYTKCPLTTLNWEFMTEKPAKNVKREIQKRYSRRLRWRASVCLPELVLQCLHIPLAWDTRDPGDHTPG